MDSFTYDIKQEFDSIIEEVSNKFNYNDDLKKVLEKIVKTTLEGKSFEERQSFYNMLRTTPIVVIDSKSQITQEELSKKMMGNVNPHIKDKDDFDKGEYGKQGISGGGFVTEAVLDEKLNLIGIKKYIYVDGFDVNGELTQAQQKYLELFQTGINVSHLIHELGHAYASEEKPYELEGNILTQRIGLCKNKYKITPLGNGQYESEQISMENLFIEEGLNSNFEEDNLAKYLGMSLEDTKKLYNDVFPASFYQPRISNMTRRLSDVGFKSDLNSWRMKDDQNALSHINKSFGKANFYEKRAKLFARNIDDEGDPNTNIISARNYIFNNPDNEYEKATLERFEKDFFPDTDSMAPMDMMNNILLQYYDISVSKYNFSVERYVKMLNVVEAQGVGLINQAVQIRNNESKEIEEKNQ